MEEKKFEALPLSDEEIEAVAGGEFEFNFDDEPASDAVKGPRGAASADVFCPRCNMVTPSFIEQTGSGKELHWCRKCLYAHLPDGRTTNIKLPPNYKFYT